MRSLFRLFVGPLLLAAKLLHRALRAAFRAVALLPPPLARPLLFRQGPFVRPAFYELRGTFERLSRGLDA